jgi:hypothetical protein
MRQNGNGNGLRRTKGLRLAIERLLPFLGDIGKAPRYEGNGIWLEYDELTSEWYRTQTIKVFRSLPWAIATSHPDPEAAKAAVRWYGDVDDIGRRTTLHWSYESALRWFTLKEGWEDFSREHVQGVIHERTPTELKSFKGAEKRYNLRTGASNV